MTKPGTKSPARALTALLLTTLVAGCATPGETPPQAPIGIHSQIESVMLESAEAWNRGDLDGFLRAYHPTVTFASGAQMRRGLDEVRQMYREAYFAQGTPPRLTFDRMESRTLGDGQVLTTGRWRLASTPAQEGLFTVVMSRTREGWRIVHDHSS
jgi:uncharacterized protein (TIGR02246 family)